MFRLFYLVFKCSALNEALVMLTICEDIYSTVQYAYKLMPVYLTEDNMFLLCHFLLYRQ